MENEEAITTGMDTCKKRGLSLDFFIVLQDLVYKVILHVDERTYRGIIILDIDNIVLSAQDCVKEIAKGVKHYFIFMQ